MTVFLKHSFVLLFMVAGIGAKAQIDVKAHFKMGQGTAVTYAIGPKKIIAEDNAQLTLSRKGSPVFYASAPEGKSGGSLLFTPDNGYYHMEKGMIHLDDNFVFEVWARPRSSGGKDLDAKHTSGIVGLGDEQNGYAIVQQGDKWFAKVGEFGMFEIGVVIQNKWTHLALVADGNHCTVWMDGAKRGVFKKGNKIGQGFTVGHNMGSEQFNGEVYEVRYATFKTGKFNPEKDFLLGYEKGTDTKRTVKTKALVRNIESPGTGKEIVDALPVSLHPKDWLINKIDEPVKLFVKKSMDGLTSMFQLNNGLVSRTFYVSDNIACVGYTNLSNGAEYVRAVKPEARIMLDSTWYDIGGLQGQPEKSYLMESWYSKMTSNPNAFGLVKIETAMPKERYHWEQKYNALSAPWPAKGLRLTMTFRPTEIMTAVKDIEIKINYEIYQGIPVISKWLEVINHNERDVTLDRFESEVLAINQDQVQRIHVESDYSFALANWDKDGSGLLHFTGDPKPYQAGQSTTKWVVDPDYHTWATQNAAEDIYLDFPHRNLLLSKLPIGPNVLINNKEPFISNITFELLNDNDDRERQSLAHRRMYKTLAPQVTESLIGAAITSHDETQLKSLIDQMEELGMEKLTIDPWPGVNYDNMDKSYLKHWGTIGKYAEERGIIMAGYELQVASRGRGPEVDCIDPATGTPGTMFGQSVCIASKWRDDYYPKMWRFYDESKFMVYSADGPYHGDACGSRIHRYHRGLEDSQWEQWKAQIEVIHEAQRRNMNILLPDWYFLNGGSSTGMGYREATANLSPQQQLLLGRQYIYDGTWYKLPTMGWMTLQLIGFYTDDPRVGLEPLNENIERYEQQLIQYLASGSQLTIRGNRMYDTPRTKAMVQKWLNWFKSYRQILTSDIIHVSRPTGRDLDCILHVDPFGKHKGMAIVFNPTDRDIEKELKLPLYYSGLKDSAIVRKEGGSPLKYDLNDKGELLITVKIKAGGTSWFVLE
ncbi:MULTISPECIES: LamG domain-containing protein [unclassified Arenibacter]|uniref:LamG domain-containing protein n=1 Tax=unclassified Arenibacter TaxID=2615047 RepID=UPI001C6EC1A0|nr:MULTISPECIES: LamG domain-containing protein [unclassified Arenibacter]